MNYRTLATRLWMVCAVLIACPPIGHARQEAKKPFAFVAATTPVAKKAVSAKKLDFLKEQIGKDATVIGRVAQIYVPKGDALQVVNLADPHWLAVTAVVRKGNFDKFPPLKSLVGKKILITGRVTDYKDKPQLELTDPAQIKIVTE